MDESFIFVKSSIVNNNELFSVYSSKKRNRSQQDFGAMSIYSEYYGFSSRELFNGEIDWKFLAAQFAFMCALNWIVSTGYYWIDLITIDSIVSAIIFITKWHSSELFKRVLYQHSYAKRLVYICLASLGVFCFNVVTWGTFTNVVRYICVPVLSMSYVVEHTLYHYKPFVDYYKGLERKFTRCIHLLVSRQLTKAIKLISETCLNYSPVIKHDEFVGVFDELPSLNTVINFLGSVAVASGLYYLDSDGPRFYTAAIKYLIRPAPVEGSINPRTYLKEIIVRRQWAELTTAYTLTKALELYVDMMENSPPDAPSPVVVMLTEFSRGFGLKIGKIMAVWSLMSLFSSQALAHICFLLFLTGISDAIVVGIVLVVAQYIGDQILLLFICELVATIVSSNLAHELFISITRYLNRVLDPLGELNRLVPLFLVLGSLQYNWWLLGGYIAYLCLTDDKEMLFETLGCLVVGAPFGWPLGQTAFTPWLFKIIYKRRDIFNWFVDDLFDS